jgi:hypothetical protein
MWDRTAEPSPADAPLLRWVALGILIPNAFSVEAALGRFVGAVTVPFKTMCKQTLATPDGPERHRRFYLAVDPRPWSALSFPP